MSETAHTAESVISIAPDSERQTGFEGKILQSLPVAVLVLGPNDEVSYANSAAERLLGQSATALRRNGLGALTTCDGSLAALVRTVRERSINVSGQEVELLGVRGGRISAHAQLSPVGSNSVEDANEVSCRQVLMVLHDAAATNEIDRQQAASANSRAASGMAAVLAHEVKNPLSGIRGAAQLIAQGANEENRALTQLVCDEVDRIRALVDRMDGLGNPRPGAIVPVNVHEVLEHVVSVASAGFAARLEFKADYDPSLPPVPAERDRLVQIFLNIIKNAAEAQPSRSGEIRLSTAFRHGARIVFPGQGAPVETPIEISISDDGPGVSPDVRDHLFSPFVTTKAGGTGLGLALAQKLVAEIGGRITCESDDTGSIFRLLLPVWSEGSDNRHMISEYPA